VPCPPFVVGGCVALVVGGCVALVVGGCVALVVGGCVALVVGDCVALVVGGCVALVVGDCVALVVGGCVALVVGCFVLGASFMTQRHFLPRGFSNWHCGSVLHQLRVQAFLFLFIATQTFSWETESRFTH